MGLLAFGDTGWGDELFFATLMTIAVAAAAIFIGFFLAAIFATFKLSKNKILNMAKTLKVNSAPLPVAALDSPP